MGSRCTIIFALCIALGQAKVFKPCELAQELYSIIIDTATTSVNQKEFAEVAVKYMMDIPMLVCVAGYHNFTTDSVQELRDGTSRYGVFGILPPKNSGESYVDDDITDDLWAFLSVLYVGEKYRNPIVHNFYSEVCRSLQNARPVYCYLNQYVFGSYPVLVPKNQHLLNSLYQDPQSERSTPSLQGNTVWTTSSVTY